jgi:hypothetical protein
MTQYSQHNQLSKRDLRILASTTTWRRYGIERIPGSDAAWQEWRRIERQVRREIRARYQRSRCRCAYRVRRVPRRQHRRIARRPAAQCASGDGGSDGEGGGEGPPARVDLQQLGGWS